MKGKNKMMEKFVFVADVACKVQGCVYAKNEEEAREFIQGRYWDEVEKPRIIGVEAFTITHSEPI